jgi:hypothetical protein
MCHKLRSDINGTLNIMRLRAKVVVRNLKKHLSYLITINRVTPIKG